ncbi:hypothetical protein AB0L67_25350 [Streptomyces flaveolus]|uniref:DUF6895 family protein n=1 Tax=Streptomyces flaveolus TaxID=67297 RepID=UPI003446D333
MPLAPIAHSIRSRALQWLHTHRELSALNGKDIAEDLDAYKALAETALAAGLVLSEGTAGNRERRLAHHLTEFCWAELKEGSLLYERLLQNPMTTDALEFYAPFSLAGYRHAGMETLIAYLSDAGIGRIVEYVPNRRLAIANALRTTGHDRNTQNSNWPDLTQATWLAGNPQPWHINWEIGYALTHTVFHLTDWGRRPTALPDDMASHLTRWLPVWTDIWAETCQWDLVGELLAVGVCLPEPCTELDDWLRLKRLQHSDGLMPCDDRAVAADPATRFEYHHHTTVVSVIAATIALARDLDVPGTSVSHGTT